MALFNNFPYTDLNDINLDYTLQKLESLYTRGEQLYSTLTTWQQATDAELEQWKATTEYTLSVWKTQTENSIDNKIQLLKAAINTAFTELRTQLEAHIAEIETTAVNAASAASDSATAAAGAASAASINNEQSKEWAIGETLEGDPVPDTNPAYENNAKYYADLLGQETEQIDQNTSDITDLKSAVTSNFKQLHSDWFDESVNLAPIPPAITGHAINTAGEIVESSSYNISDYIPLKPNTAYYPVSLVTFAFYTVDKTFIQRINVTSRTAFTTPNNAYYGRISSNSYYVNWRLYEGTTDQDSADYYSKIKQNKIETSHALIESMMPISSTAVDVLATNTENLFSLSNFTDGISISNSGVETTSLSYRSSGYIPVNPKETLVPKALVTLSEYRLDKTFIKRNDCFNGTPITLSSLTYFVRISSNVAVTDWQLNRGSTLAAFSYGGMESIVPLTTLASRSKDFALFSRGIGETYLLNNVPTVEFGSATTAAEMYEAYDEFVTDYPTYVTKTVLGQDDFGNTIAIYKFIPEEPTHSIQTKKTRIFINCGIHGYEHVSAIMTYYVLQEMLTNWSSSPILEVLRHDVEIWVIPVSNPSGWDDYTRTNRNDVDLNRNFPAGFSPTAQNNGSTPLSQKETQYINSVLENNSFDIVLDFHNFSWSEEYANNFMWVVSTDALTQHIAQKYIGRMTRVFRNAYSFTSQDPSIFFGYTNGDRGGMVKDQAKKDGAIVSCTFELASHWGVQPSGTPYNTEHTQGCIECLINFLAMSLEAVQLQYREPNVGLGQSNY